METFYTKCKIENAADRTKSLVLSRILVDTGSKYTWAPAKSIERIGITEKKSIADVALDGMLC